MFLKCGIVKLCTASFEELTYIYLRKEIGHNYLKACQILDIPLSSSQRESLLALGDLVVDGARYPILPRYLEQSHPWPFETDHTAQWNERNALIWSDSHFRSACKLVLNIREHVDRIDNDEANPAHLEDGPIGFTGHWVFRYGGNLNSYIIYTLCDENPGISLESIKQEIESRMHFLFAINWSDLKFLQLKAGRQPKQHG